MSHLHEPEKLNLQRAEHLAGRWKRVGYTFLGCAVAATMINLGQIAVVVGLLAFVCLLESSALQGWAGGYKAHQHECRKITGHDRGTT